MVEKIIKNKFNLFLKKFEINFFYLSAIFLPSALPISVLFLLISISSFLLKHINNIDKNKTNYLLLLAAVLMFTSAIISYYKFDPQIIYSYWDKSITTNTNKENIFVDLFNWIPLILLYFTSQKHLKNIEGRIRFARNILIGTIPVIVSCFLQYWLKLYGPFKFLFGSIVWFQKPLEGNLGVSGLFSNQNYAGSWLATILPFSIFLILKNKNKFKKLFSSFIALNISYLIILTTSRNALIGLIFSIVIIFGLNGFFFCLPLFFVIGFTTIFLYFFNPEILEKILQVLFSNPLIMKLLNFELSNYLQYPRLEIINISLNLISQKPFWGFGSGTFASMYGISGGLYNAQHTHSLPLQIAYNYGIPVAFLICFIISYLYFKAAYKLLFTSDKIALIDRCWLTSTTVAIIYNLTDITYYDGKISILTWILFAGLNFISTKKILKN